MECFDPHTNKWMPCTSMSKRRGGVGVATCNGFLYAVGGHEAPATNPTCSRFDCAERYEKFPFTVCHLAYWVKIEAGHILDYFSQKIDCFLYKVSPTKTI